MHAQRRGRIRSRFRTINDCAGKRAAFTRPRQRSGGSKYYDVQNAADQQQQAASRGT